MAPDSWFDSKPNAKPVTQLLEASYRLDGRIWDERDAAFKDFLQAERKERRKELKLRVHLD